MKTHNVLHLGLLAMIALALVACETTLTVKPPDESAVVVGEVVEMGNPTPVPAETETETVCNCGIVDGTMTKQVEMSYTASYAIMWEYGGEIGFDVSVEPLGVGGNIGEAISVAYGEQWESSRTRAIGFPLTAEADTNMEYTIEWREVWQAGHIPISTAGEQEQVEYRYLVRIDGDIVDSRDLGCAQGCEAGAAPTLPPTEVDLPEGYELYDDFTASGALDANWSLNDADQICTVDVGSGALSFNCRNETSDDLLAALHPSNIAFWESTGIAASMRIGSTGGPPHLITNWTCQESSEERAYHLALDTESVTAEEFYPREDWRVVELGKVAVAPGQVHLLQIERSSNGVAFFVDGQPVPLAVAPDWLDCLSMRDWAFDFFVWPDHSIVGQVEFVGLTEFDVLDRFNDASLNPSMWCRTEGSVEPLITDGSLSLDATSSGEYVGGSVWACLDEVPIQAVEADVRVLDGSDMSHTGLMARLGHDGTQEWYVSFGLLGNGDIYLYRAVVGESAEDYEGTWPGSGLGTSHRLRIEWTETEARFIADGEPLTSLASSEPGWWVALSGDANEGGKTVNVFDWVGWSFR